MAVRWEGALLRMEADLEALAGAIARGDAPVLPPWEPPVDLGPLPNALVARAQGILARAGQVRSEGAATLHVLADEQRQLATRREAGNTYAGVHGSSGS